jgi:hypothetical protein
LAESSRALATKLAITRRERSAGPSHAQRDCQVRTIATSSSAQTIRLASTSGGKTPGMARK